MNNILTKKHSIFGREKEIEYLIKHFAKTLNDEFSVCTIIGEAGVGKTYLVSEVMRRLQNVNYVSGKFKRYNNDLFSAMRDILRGVVDYTLTLSDEKLESVKKVLSTNLAGDSYLVISICPETEKLLGYYKKIQEEDYHKIEYKLTKAVLTFLDIMSQELSPLIIHFDDLQWADESSLRLIQELCSNDNGLNSHLVLSYRDGFQCVLDNISLELNLKRLSRTETETLINALFDFKICNIHEISGYFYKVTLGTPFYILSLVESMIREKRIYYNEDECYAFDVDFLKSLQLPNDIKNILTENIDRLSQNEYEVLELLVCLGGQTDTIMLYKIVSNSEKFERVFEKLYDIGLIITEQFNDKVSYSFSHDIIYEIIHQSITDNRIQKHYEIVSKLIDDPDKIYIEEHRIFIAAQIHKCKDIIFTEADSTKYVLELYYAGLKAKQMTLIEDASNFFELCIDLMPLSDQTITKSLVSNATFELSECLYLQGKTKEAETLFEALVNSLDKAEELANYKSRFLLLYTYSGMNQKALQYGFEVLEHLKFKLQTRRIRRTLFIDILKCRWLLSHKKFDSIEHMPLVMDKRIIMIENTIIRMAAIANLVDDELFSLLITKLSLLSLQHGISELSAPAYASFSYIQFHYLHDSQKAIKLVNVAESILKKSSDEKCMTYFILGAFIKHWYTSDKISINYLKEAIDSGVNSGEFQYAGYSFSTLVEMYYIQGKPLDKLYEIFKILDSYDKRLKQDITKSTLFILQNHLERLSVSQSEELSDDLLESLDDSQELTYLFFKLQRLYLSNELMDCYAILPRIEALADMFKGFMLEVDLLFYLTMVRMDNNSNLKGIEGYRNRQIVRKSIKKVEKWIDQYKDNHYSRFLYLKAKYLEVFENSSEVGNLYEEGIAFAKRSNQFNLVALGQLLASKYYESNKTISSIYLKEAVNSFDKWGAKSIADLYRLSDCSEDDLTVMESDEIVVSKIDYNLSDCMNQVEMMDKDEAFLYVLRSLMAPSICEYGAIYLERDDQLHLAYEAHSHHDSDVITSFSKVPLKVLRYVARTGTEIVLNKKPTGGVFANDTYFTHLELLSLVCLPLKYMNVFIGVVYLKWPKEDKCDDYILDMIKNYRPLLIAKVITDEKQKLEITYNRSDIPLTRREVEVFELVIKGLTNKVVGEKLNISLSTVKTHIINIYSKLEIKNRVGAVEKAKLYGFLD